MNKSFFSVFFLLLLLPFPAQSQAPAAHGFSAAASPPRYELAVKPGQVLREVLTIYNFGRAPEQYRVRSTEWTMTADDQMLFNDALGENSCRSWLRLERHKVTVMPKRPRKFRWEVHVPEDAGSRECTFAIMIEGIGEGAVTEVAGGIKLPVQGRIAVIVYLAVGDVEPQLGIGGYQLIQHNGRLMPALKVTNAGLAHGRLDGVLAGQDANGREYDVSVSTLPVMAGQTRMLVLNPVLPGQKDSRPADVAYPLALKGTIFWEKGKFDVDTTIGR